MKNTMVPHTPVIVWSFPFLVSYVQLVTQQYKSITLWKHLCNQGSHYEKCGWFAWDNFCYAKETIACNHQIMLFTISKDERNTEEDSDKSLKNALDVLRYAKRAEATSNSEIIKPVALAVIELR